MAAEKHKVRTPLFPTYARVKQLLRLLQGKPKPAVLQMRSSILSQTGTPQKPVDWSEPDKWIHERLSGADADLATHIWEGSRRTVNPRHMLGPYLFINGYDLLIPDGQQNYQLSDIGRAFLDDDTDTVRQLDDAEGLLQLLGILSTKKRAMRRDLLPEWSEFLADYSKFGTDSTRKDTLRRRLVNLTDRELVEKEGISYAITPDGLAYLKRVGMPDTDPRREVIRSVDAYNIQQRDALREALATMPPYSFEHLISDLLEAMGYEDVTVTRQAGDKGVDVVGTVQLGITSVKEVVQVKRTPKSSISRPILDQLRGALPYFQAIRGTIITLGKVSAGARKAAIFQGAAPITLIDGDKLIELLVEHSIGIKKRELPIWDVDQDYFKNNEEANVD